HNRSQVGSNFRLGTVVDVVNRILQRFERQGLISISRKQFKILDRDGLKEVTKKFECAVDISLNFDFSRRKFTPEGLK
ncbi:MAG: helix-turn-helix domain-containing protein, partial [Chloroflexota bacterium]|nr:helix-turn-helix domain-containing protein [Chloroflexota bacterium]